MFGQTIIAYFSAEGFPKLREFSDSDKTDERCFTLKVESSTIVLTETFVNQASEKIREIKAQLEKNHG
jgi:hypothetical protein